jgi:hypothetical protein
MSARARESELALQQAGAAAGIDQPACGDLAGSGKAGKPNPMNVRAERDPLDATAVQHVDTRCPLGREEMVFEAPAIQLERRNRRKDRGPKLEATRDVAIVAFREEVAKSQLFELMAAQVRLEPQPFLKVVRADLDARFAHLERRLAHRVLSLFDNQHAERRCFETQLPRQRTAGETSADDQDVVFRICHGPTDRHSSARTRSGPWLVKLQIAEFRFQIEKRSDMSNSNQICNSNLK